MFREKSMVVLKNEEAWFLPQENKNGLSVRSPKHLHKYDSFEFYVDVEPSWEQVESHTEQALVCMNGKHLGIFIKRENEKYYVQSGLWSKNGDDEKATICIFELSKYEKEQYKRLRLNYLVDTKNNKVKLTIKGKGFKKVIEKKFDGELVSDYEYSFIWLGAGNAFESCAPEYRLHYTGKVNGFKVWKNKELIFKSSFMLGTLFKFFDESDSGNHLLKYSRDWFE